LVWFKMTSAIGWAEKYRPQSLKEIVGNKKAVQDLRTWAEEWLSGIPEKRAVILHGSAGIGKTSSAHALARDLGWEVIELNASDQRTAGVIEKIAGSAASMNTFFGGKRLIILDEADNIHGSADRGGMRAIAEIIKTTLQPIVLIANDVYGLTPTIRNLCLEIKFGSVLSRSMAPALKKVCESEGISCSLDAVQQIAENAGGDFRSAINDLQAAASGKKVLEVEDISTSGRDVKENIFKTMQRIFKSTDCKKALEVARRIDESPENLVHWIDENLPIQYARKDGDLEDIRIGFGYLSKADLYLGRVKKRQNYRMWRYASMLMVCGAAISKTRDYPGFIKYQQPSLWRRLGQTRSKRDLRDNIASKIGEHSFDSMRYSRNNLLELYSRMVKDETSAIEITAGLGLELEELIYLSGSIKASKKLQKIYDEAQEFLRGGSEEKEGMEFFKIPIPSGNDKQIPSGCTVKPLDKKGGESPGKSETSNFQNSEDEQKTFDLGFDTFSGISGEKETSKKNELGNFKPDNVTPDNVTPDNFTKSDGFTPDNFEPVEKNAFSRHDEPENRDFSGSEKIESKISTESSKKKVLTKSELVVEKVPELKPANFEGEAEEVPKKKESKSQKTLFDF